MNRFLSSLLLIAVVYSTVVSGFFGPKVHNAQKFKIKQKMFSIGSSFNIKDEHNKPAFKVDLKKIGLGGQHLHITDPNGKNEYYSIKHLPNPLGLAKYQILEHGKVIADVNRKLNLLGGKKFKVDSDFGSYKIEGNFRSREFKIMKDRHLVATISKKFFAMRDEYGVKIEKGQNVPFILCLAIIVDEVAHD